MVPMISLLASILNTWAAENDGVTSADYLTEYSCLIYVTAEFGALGFCH